METSNDNIAGKIKKGSPTFHETPFYDVTVTIIIIGPCLRYFILVASVMYRQSSLNNQLAKILQVIII